MSTFIGGALFGIALTLAALLIGVRWLGRGARRSVPDRENPVGDPDATILLSRDLVQLLIDEGLRDVQIPLVSLRDPSIRLHDGGIIGLRLRGDTALLGAQPIELRVRVRPDARGLRVVTEAAEVRGLGDVTGPLTDRLDQTINAELARRVPLDDRIEVLRVDGDEQHLTIEARWRGFQV